MKHLKLFFAASVAIVLLSGCFYAHVKQPLDTNVDRTVLGEKSGTATSYSVLWVAAWGDAGTQAAARNGRPHDGKPHGQGNLQRFFRDLY